MLAGTPAARALRIGSAAAAGALAVVLLSPSPALGIAGFAAMGLSLAALLPVLYRIAGRLGTDRDGSQGVGQGAAAAVARFTTMTYAGILLAPPVIGWGADVLGLRWTLVTLIPLLAIVAAAAGKAARPRSPEPVSCPS